MAEIWYLGIGTETLEGLEPRHTASFAECVELLGVTPEKWESAPDEVPSLKTGNPLVDESGYIYVMLRAGEDDVSGHEDKGWKPGWYRSALTIVGFEKNVRKKPK